MLNILKEVGALIVGELLFYTVLVGSLVLVGFSLVAGTDVLVAIGLSRGTAGSIVAGVVTIACIAGLAAFAKYGIDW